MAALIHDGSDEIVDYAYPTVDLEVRTVSNRLTCNIPGILLQDFDRVCSLLLLYIVKDEHISLCFLLFILLSNSKSRTRPFICVTSKGYNSLLCMVK